MAKIKVIQPEEAEGALKKIYDGLSDSRGKIAEVHKIQSLNPHSITAHMDLYKVIMFKKSALSRLQREMLGVVTSRANNCEYCQIHHAEAVNHYWKDDAKTTQLRTDYTLVELDSKDRMLCDYAFSLTKNPLESAKSKQVEKMKEAGITDKEILDATLVISYFNFVNRIVLSLGVELENNPGGYNYE
jgi:uncharacterized peroxidase-related enzyme